MDLKELGSRLKAERERQGFTIEQIMELTKISRVNVYAIEDGNKKDFPHPVYAKGFIKNYAKVLGLNSEEIGEEFSKFYSVDEEPEESLQNSFDQNNSAQKDYSVKSSRSSFASILMILVLIGVLAGFIYYLHDNALLDFGKTDQVEVVVEEAPEVATNSEADSEELEVVVETQAEESEQEAATEAQAVEEVKAEEVVIVPEEEATTTPVAQVQGNNVVITAKPNQACWLKVSIDGKSSEYVLNKSQSLLLSYDKSLKIKFGNGGGVDVTYNGKPFVFNAVEGKVKTVDFPVSE
ncbi:helix-turn-helix domain-containing protein [Maridesulfovibrio frigidus]|uniref:helix-turn-helix domain-containing protein n=1 Tax=Maridesulfovibrio frigidus TaxID=340956 RepID=UPI0004E155E6|nr:RodZ domain-containing protein [Maridesulfovibrio frigidus]